MGNRGGRIDRDFVLKWAARYPLGAREIALFGEVGPALAERGFYQRADFLAVGSWKSPRPRPLLESNSDDDIQKLTRLAYMAPERFGYQILALLKGVSVPMASALLTVWDPHRFTITDFRALETLRAQEELGEAHPTYPEYLELCRSIASRTGTGLRTLDRALWTWSKEKGTEDPPSEDDELAA